MQLSIILPTYNEAGNIGNLIKVLIKQAGLKQHQLEIIVIDDNSPDGTAKKVDQLIRQKLPIKLFIRKNQRGLATAIYLGITKAKGKIIVLMDTDFNHQPGDVRRLLQSILSQRTDLVIGSRYISGGGMHQSEAGVLQFFGSRYGSLLVGKMLNLPVKENLSGFLAVRRTVLNQLPLKYIFKGYGEYCINLLYQCHQHGFRITEIPVIYGQRHSGQSKSRLISMFINYFKTALWLWVRKP